MDESPELRHEPELRRIIFEVGDHVEAGWVAPVSLRHGKAGQRGVAAVGMQAEPIVVAPPHGADSVRLFEDDGIEAALAKASRRSQTRWPGADHQGVAGFGHRALPV